MVTRINNVTLPCLEIKWIIDINTSLDYHLLGLKTAIGNVTKFTLLLAPILILISLHLSEEKKRHRHDGFFKKKMTTCIYKSVHHVITQNAWLSCRGQIAGRRKNRVASPDRKKSVFFSSEPPRNLPPNIDQGVFPESKIVRAWSWPLSSI